MVRWWGALLVRMKRMVVLIRNAPVTTVKASEALRMALGLTLSDHQVAVLYMEDGAYGALDLRPEVIAQPGVRLSIEFFEGMKIRQWVERDAIEAWALPLLRKDVEPIDRHGALDLVQKADVVISF